MGKKKVTFADIAKYTNFSKTTIQDILIVQILLL